MRRMVRAPALAVIALLIASVPASARAQGADAPDEVDLKNGGMIRGTVVTVEPEREVVILVQGTGEARHVPWTEVAGVDRGKFTRPPPTTSAPVDGAVRIHVEADSPAVTLEQVTGGTGVRVTARPVCRAPCDQIVDARGPDRFFFAGEGLMASPRFHLAGHGGAVVLDVKAGSAARRAGGFAMAFIGGAGFIAGISMIALGAISTSPGAPPSTGLAVAGGVVGGVGLGLLVGGIVLVVKTRTTFAFRPPVLTF
jgi:hypothetical protein